MLLFDIINRTINTFDSHYIFFWFILRRTSDSFSRIILACLMFHWFERYFFWQTGSEVYSHNFCIWDHKLSWPSRTSRSYNPASFYCASSHIHDPAHNLGSQKARHDAAWAPETPLRSGKGIHCIHCKNPVPFLVYRPSFCRLRNKKKAYQNGTHCTAFLRYPCHTVLPTPSAALALAVSRYKVSSSHKISRNTLLLPWMYPSTLSFQTYFVSLMIYNIAYYFHTGNLHLIHKQYCLAWLLEEICGWAFALVFSRLFLFSKWKTPFSFIENRVYRQSERRRLSVSGSEKLFQQKYDFR